VGKLGCKTVDLIILVLLLISNRIYLKGIIIRKQREKMSLEFVVGGSPKSENFEKWDVPMKNLRTSVVDYIYAYILVYVI